LFNDAATLGIVWSPAWKYCGNARTASFRIGGFWPKICPQNFTSREQRF
jgi:hypothetical protein